MIRNRLENYKTIGDYGIQAGQEITLAMEDKMEYYCIPTDFEKLANKGDINGIYLSQVGMDKETEYTFRITRHGFTPLLLRRDGRVIDLQISEKTIDGYYFKGKIGSLRSNLKGHFMELVSFSIYTSEYRRSFLNDLFININVDNITIYLSDLITCDFPYTIKYNPEQAKLEDEYERAKNSMSQEEFKIYQANFFQKEIQRQFDIPEQARLESQRKARAEFDKQKKKEEELLERRRSAINTLYGKRLSGSKHSRKSLPRHIRKMIRKEVRKSVSRHIRKMK